MCTFATNYLLFIYYETTYEAFRKNILYVGNAPHSW